MCAGRPEAGSENRCVAKVTMFRAAFSAAAWMQATVDWNSEAGLPTLYKKTYKGGTNWGVWHFTGRLPLKYVDPATGAPLLSVVFGPMPRASAVLSGVCAPRAGFCAPPAPPPLPVLPWAGGRTPGGEEASSQDAASV